MGNLIYNLSSTNNNEQKGNNINTTRYLEFNKNSILDLDEKNYKNPCWVLTNKALDTAASPSNPVLSLPESHLHS